MTTWPPELPLDDWTNDTPNRERHPAEHNKIARAIKVLVEQAAQAGDVYTKTETDGRYVRSVNGAMPDPDGNVTVATDGGGGGGGTITSVNGQPGPAVSLSYLDVGGVGAEDPRLNDQRVSPPNTVDSAQVVSGGLAPSVITGTAVITTDTRLSNARTPAVHAASHATGGSDPLTAAAIGALTQTLADGRYVRTVNGVAPTTAGNVVVTAGGGTGSVMFVRKVGTTWGVRPTSAADVLVFWVGPGSDPAIVTSGTAGMRDGLDVRVVTAV